MDLAVQPSSARMTCTFTSVMFTGTFSEHLWARVRVFWTTMSPVQCTTVEQPDPSKLLPPEDRLSRHRRVSNNRDNVYFHQLPASNLLSLASLLSHSTTTGLQVVQELGKFSS
ncbi:hypothetical protein C8Q74DRAFT_221438 [Fomes fomentarius]|nr:hypothetical protein C8Q74DRAFT_221438 [Fomes fomentarius]